ncbi:MAG: hypothetical protein A2234_03840 [Elusimicrobia bacterium RIFOXYA2_FULL_58_8]|nr:MAG: hypothetical protein A2234_03840 [Elusimicrobia bacterium RIFOXYA2_FULL_58_8]
MDKLRQAGRFIFLAAQKKLVLFSLLAVYLPGIGTMAALSWLFRLSPRATAVKGSFWKTAQPRPCDTAEAAEQS